MFYKFLVQYKVILSNMFWRFWTCLKKMERIILLMILIFSLLSILSLNERTTHHWNKIHQNMLAKLPDYLPDSIRGSFANISRNGNASASRLFTTTTKAPMLDLKENYREWFDNRSLVEPFRSQDKVHPAVFDYLITNSKLCGNEPVDILIYFHSAWNNRAKRRFLRETWASSKTFHNISIKTVFILGSPIDVKHQLTIDLENVVYRDIIQGDFNDTFKNLSLKSALAIQWINTYCIQTRYVIKADDDIFINIFKAIEDLLPVLVQRKQTVMCHFHKASESVIVRSPKSKWFIPNDVFKGEKHFPRFCSGYVAIFTSDLIPLLYRSSFQSPIIPVDDVYMFGLLPHKDQFMNYIDIRQNLTLNMNLALKQYAGNDPQTYIGAIAWHLNTMEKYWALTLNRLTPWGRKQARITSMRAKMGPKSLS